MMQNDIFSGLVADIESVAARVKYLPESATSPDWQFLAGSRRVLERQTQVALITTNPGSGDKRGGYPECEHGNIYLAGAGYQESSFQRQIRLLFAQVHALTNWGANGDELLRESLIGYFIPFRTANVAELKGHPQSFELARELGHKLWKTALSASRPKLIFTIDHITFGELRTLIEDVYGSRMAAVDTGRKVGWGQCRGAFVDYTGETPVRLVRLPHLSRYRIFGRNNQFTSEFMEVVCAPFRSL